MTCSFLVAAVMALGCGLLGAGCGGSGDALVPAAEPARSPPLAKRPAGRVIHVGHKPEGLAAFPAARVVAVGLTNPDRLALVDMDSGRVIRRVALPEAPRHLAAGGPRGPVLVPAEKANELVRVPLRRGPSRETKVGRAPHDAAFAAGRVFVGEEGGDHLAVIRAGRLERRLPAPAQPGGVAVTPDGSRVAVVGVSERALELYDARSRRELGKVDVGVGPTHVASLYRRFYVVDTRGGALLEVRTEPRLRIRRRIDLPGAPYGIATDEGRRRFWVTLTARNELVELTDNRRVRSFPTVRQPNSVAVDAKTGRLFVASRKDGTLQIIDPGRAHSE